MKEVGQFSVILKSPSGWFMAVLRGLGNSCRSLFAVPSLVALGADAE